MALTKQQIFSNSIIAYMSELEGGKLKKFCETKTQKGGESVTFNRIAKSKGDGNIVSMYGTSGVANDGGDMKEIKATIKYVAEQQKVKDEDIKKTGVEVTSTYVKSLSRGVMRREDKAIIDAIVALTPQASPAEGVNCNKVQIAGVTEAVDVKKIIKEIRKAQALAGETPDNHRGVALVMSAEDWAELSTSDYALKNEYAVVYGGGKTGEADKFYGAEVVLMDDTNVGGANHKMYVIPSNTVCFAEWEGSVRGDAVFVPTDGMTWHLQALKSIGVAIAESTAITQLTAE